MENIGQSINYSRSTLLSVLNLSNNNINSKGLNILLKEIKKNNNLQKLILDNNYISDISSFKSYFMDNLHLTYLSLKKCAINNEGVEYLVEGL